MLVWLWRLPHASTNRITKPSTTPSLAWVSGIATMSYECVSYTIIFRDILHALNNFQFVPTQEVDPHHHSLHNVITMVINLHSAFDSFNLWLEPVLGQVCCLVYSVILHSSYMVYSGKHLWRLWETPWPVPSAHPITCHVQCRALCHSRSRSHG